jgi:hypothetical protein
MQLFKPNSKELIRLLQATRFQFGAANSSLKNKIIESLEYSSLQNEKDLIAVHDTLLFLLAYPENPGLYNAAEKMLQNLVSRINYLRKQNKNLLDGTGIAGTTITGSFSYQIACWLTENFPADTEIDSSAADSETVKLFFRQLLPRVEYENISEDNWSLRKRIKRLKGDTPGSLLEWLVFHLNKSPIPESTKEVLFHNLKIFIRWKLNHSLYNRTFIRIPVKKFFYHNSIEKTTDYPSIIKNKIPEEKILTRKEKERLINIARSTLTFLFRETDPFSNADIKETHFFEMERGVGVAVYGMNPRQRYILESYMGYLVFKNGIPVAYGGGWLFGERCQFGINILEPFRGGESAYVFAQLLRIYHQYFGAYRFVIKPYQFGKNNPEAIRSGAFWFYYKLGFIPEQKELKLLAATEWKKKQKNKQYRTPPETLKKYTGSNLVLNLTANPVPAFDAAVLSSIVTDYINKQFNGNRIKAVQDCQHKTKLDLHIRSWKGWNKDSKKAFDEWSLLSQAMLSVSQWNNAGKKKFIQLIKSKTGEGELNFIRQLQQLKPFWHDLQKIIR